MMASSSQDLPEARFVPVEETDLAGVQVDGLSPRHVSSPTDATGVAEALSLASAQGWALVPRRGGTKIGLGNAPRAFTALLDLRGLSGIVDYTPADLTVTVLAGTPLVQVQEVLAEHGQMVALDPPIIDGASIGGILATNDSGPRRLAYGTARDLVLGMRVATPDGRLTRSGGKVVKNVTGYDLHKLHIGGLGTLGTIVEVSLKLHPVPRRVQTLAAEYAACSQAMQAVLRLARSPLDPLSIVLASSRDNWTLLVEHAGGTAALARKIDDTADYCRDAGAGSVDVLDGPGRDRWLQQWTPADVDTTRIKVALLPNRLAEYCEGMHQESALAELDVECALFAGNGILHATWRGGSVESQAALINSLRARAETAGGSLVVQQAPLAVKRSVDAWGRPPGGLSLMQTLKQTYDPQGIMNPGRYVGGI